MPEPTFEDVPLDGLEEFANVREAEAAIAAAFISASAELADAWDEFTTVTGDCPDTHDGVL